MTPTKAQSSELHLPLPSLLPVSLQSAARGCPMRIEGKEGEAKMGWWDGRTDLARLINDIAHLYPASSTDKDQRAESTEK